MGLSKQGRYAMLAVCAAAVLSPGTAVAQDNGQPAPVAAPDGVGELLTQAGPELTSTVREAVWSLPAPPVTLKNNEVSYPLVEHVATETANGGSVTGALLPDSAR
jgi:hypothetical protein